MIDSHAHLDMDRFDADREQVIARAKREGVHTILSLAMIDETDSYQRAFPMVAEHGLVTAVGCHPHDAKVFDDKGSEEASERAREPKLRSCDWRDRARLPLQPVRTGRCSKTFFAAKSASPASSSFR